MAIRTIVQENDPILRKVSRPVEAFDGRLAQLLDDMADTLHKAGGVGLAGPQVGILRRLFIMDLGDERGVIEAVNPKIVKTRGEQEDQEGCLSCPGKWGIVRRPATVTLQAQDRHGKWFVMTGKELTARCICHETDHLDGILFLDKCIRMVDPTVSE